MRHAAKLLAQKKTMNTISLTEARAHLRALVERAEAGESITITRRGKRVAMLTPVVRPRNPIDAASLRAMTDKMPFQTESAGDFMRRIRDEERY